MASHLLPDSLMKKVDDYVDSLAPQIQPRITSELETFQQKTLDSLEDQIVDAFRKLFNRDSGGGGGSRGLDNGVPDSYGGQSLPFADEIAKLTRGFGDLAGGAGDDLRDIFDLTEGGGNTITDTQSRGIGDSHGHSGGGGFKTFLSAAVDVVQDHVEKKTGGHGGQKFELDGLLGVISNTVKDAARNPEEKARMITPEIKEKVGVQLREQHATIAEKFTRIALDHIKRWLRGNTTTRDLGDGVRGEVEDHVKDLVKGLGGLFSKKHHGEGSARGLGDRDHGTGEGESSGGFSKLISEKLSTGLGRVHREVRLEFRKSLGDIEKQLFELLPDQFQRPLEKILGGNPFDSQLDQDVGVQGERGLGGDLKTTLLSKIRGLVQKVQETLRGSILGVVNGGHRKFERQSWVFVQTMVEQKVQKYLPKVKITVPDDIGNEGVSVGAPAPSTQISALGPVTSPPGQPQYGQPQSQQPHGQAPQYQQSPGGYQQSQPHDQGAGYQPSQPSGQYQFPPPPSYPPPPNQPQFTHPPGQSQFPPPPTQSEFPPPPSEPYGQNPPY
jgi:hypothetical protein